jgi:Domain of unknown function (DUF2760)
MDYVVPVLATLGAVVVLKVLVLLIVGRGSLARVGLAWTVFRRTMGEPEFAARVQPLLLPPEPPKPIKRSGEALRLLRLLQREGRLLDFLLEDIATATDEQIGAGVRDIHKKSQAVIKDHLVLEPVLSQNEGDKIEVPVGFDPSAITVTGNVTGNPPFRGAVIHRGWRVRDFTLNQPEGQDEFVVAPAEVELP